MELDVRGLGKSVFASRDLNGDSVKDLVTCPQDTFAPGGGRVYVFFGIDRRKDKRLIRASSRVRAGSQRLVSGPLAALPKRLATLTCA